MTDLSFTSLADFAASFDAQSESPPWSLAAAQDPLPSFVLEHLEDVLDTIVAVQRADWLEDGVQVGPGAYAHVYQDLLDCSRTLKVPVPPAVIAGCGMSGQGIFGTNGRAFLHLSTFFFDAAQPDERKFLAGRFIGQLATQQVTAATLYALLVDQGGLRSVAARAVGPLVDVLLTPLSIGMRLALSRWHRAAVFNADRAGLICAGSLGAAGSSLLRMGLGKRHDIDIDTYLAQLDDQDRASPGRWTELFASMPWTHKRIQALQYFTQSQIWADMTGLTILGALDDEQLEKQTVALLGVAV